MAGEERHGTSLPLRNSKRAVSFFLVGFQLSVAQRERQEGETKLSPSDE